MIEAKKPFYGIKDKNDREGREPIEETLPQLRWHFCRLEVVQFIKNDTDGRPSKSPKGDSLKGK